MKLLSLFSGIGAFEKALDKTGIDYELVNFCEFDKYAVKSYCAIHGVDELKNLGDITKVDEKELPQDIDMITYGFPCQDISLAGKQKGMFHEDGTQTRSGLFFEALRIIEETKPKVAIAENVKNLTGKKFKEQFEIVLGTLEEAGYNNYWKVLNAKDYGVPQNRERVFIISIRKDIDTGSFTFPKALPLELRLKDMLDGEVDEKFYLSDKMLSYLQRNTQIQKEKGNGFKFTPTDGNCIAKTITTKEGQRMENNFILPRAYGRKYGSKGDSIDLLRIRKLTPKECFRLMGFDDEDFKKAEAVNSNTQLYKQAGNSIVVNVLIRLFENLKEACVI